MRNFFIVALERVIDIFVVVGVLIVVGLAILTALSSGPSELQGIGLSGPLGGAVVLLGGLLYITVFAGFAYLGFGIYQNTKTTAKLLERSATSSAVDQQAARIEPKMSD